MTLGLDTLIAVFAKAVIVIKRTIADVAAVNALTLIFTCIGQTNFGCLSICQIYAEAKVWL